MTDLLQLEVHARELLTSLNHFSTHRQDDRSTLSPPEELELSDSARESALATIAKIQVILSGPSDFIHQMTTQTQILACMRWMGEFHVLAYIPQDGSALMKDISDLINVSESQLCRIIRMVTPMGFLKEPQPGYVAHSALSASFASKQSYVDAMMFLANTLAPAALGMATAQHDSEYHEHARNSLCNHESAISTTFSSIDKTQLPLLQRRWHAYLRHGMGYFCDTATDILTCLEPFRMEKALIVEVGARSTERATILAKLYPMLHITVQLRPTCSTSGKNRVTASNVDRMRPPRITILDRVPGSPQPIQDAAVYIINLPLPDPGMPPSPLAMQIRAEMMAHLNTLRTNRSATMVLVVPSLSDCGAESGKSVSLAGIRDFSLLQLANEREMRLTEIIDLLHKMSDSEGRLVLVNKVISAGRYGIVGLEVKYQAYADR
ncbi:conserved hypothetical protein [Talaromyces stipitatus ATCC 10500]|uniref:O-methyltransferase n=1 Tax=Talaromyces stipitatus (strain ATCC 10500 / CBS 375.48 / QM 6759 / NRRL 1006) TaxID=441959 RepID=B8MCS3_TALSN|nr:uncharacterized protein TSTA_126830 [Talaromyces stipitatus ATCC 10500]EED18975.1 conserved hypothetical protein [Talaromyces stipitatus ATCC 10500]